jgi:hypothetical protein
MMNASYGYSQREKDMLTASRKGSEDTKMYEMKMSRKHNRKKSPALAGLYD